MTEHVNLDDLIIRLELLFVAFQGAIPGHAIAFEVFDQGDDGAGAFLIFLQLGDTLNHRGVTITHELIQELHIAGGGPRCA